MAKKANKQVMAKKAAQRKRKPAEVTGYEFAGEFPRAPIDEAVLNRFLAKDERELKEQRMSQLPFTPDEHRRYGDFVKRDPLLNFFAR